MTVHFIAVTEHMHTCPANPESHAWDIHRTLLATTSGGPCRHPVTVRVGNISAVIPCGRRYPADQQCDACRITITVVHTTSHHTEAVTRSTTPAPTGPAPSRAVSRQPSAGVPADPGHPPLCRPRPEPHRASA